MKRTLFLLTFSYLISVSLRAQTGTWTQKNAIGANDPDAPKGISGAQGFAIGAKGFVGLVGSGKGFVEYDPAINRWTERSDFGGTRRSGVAVFGIGGKGYIGTGLDSATQFRKDFWAYDSVTDTWSQIADLGGLPRYGAFSFSVGGLGYVGSGFDGQTSNIYLNDFWQYDPTLNTWTRKATVPGQPRTFAAGFSIGSKGYFGTGNSQVGNPAYMSDFYEYDPATDTWTQETDFPGGNRTGCVGFGIGPKGYLGMGDSAVRRIDGVTQPFFNDLYEYDPSTGSWTQKTSLPAAARVNAVGFSIGDKGIVGTGQAGNCNVCQPYIASDFWEYDPTADAWTSIAGFADPGMSLAVSFGIGGKGYIGMGETPTPGRLSSWWEYDSVSGSWTQKADFPGGLRSYPVGFAIGNMGYAGTGQEYLGGAYNSDFWQFDPVANTWTAKAPFGGGGRSQATGFSIGDKGYIGMGTVSLGVSGYQKDLWEYDPATDSWTQKANFGGGLRAGALGFAIGNKGYVGTGFDTLGGFSVAVKDFWQYDPATDTWTQKADFGGGNRTGAVGFGIDGMGYIGWGANQLQDTADLWQYDTASDSWTQVAAFPGAARSGGAAFTLGHVAYAGTGEDSHNVFYNDLWQFDPPAGIPLPLTMDAFTAIYEPPATLLRWRTEQESNTSVFNIQRSGDGQHFTLIGSVAAAGNSTAALDYHFTDAGAAEAGSRVLYYRLAETDRDGRPAFSSIAVVNIDAAAGDLAVYPNPATDAVTIRVGVNVGSDVLLTVRDMSGGQLLVQHVSLYAGSNSIPLSIGQWPAGIYSVTLEGAAVKWQGKIVKK